MLLLGTQAVNRAALNVASAEWSKLTTTPEDALLWRLSGHGDWELHEGDPALSIASFAADIARREGWQEEEGHWQRNAEIRADPSQYQRLLTGVRVMADASHYGTAIAYGSA